MYPTFATLDIASEKDNTQSSELKNINLAYRPSTACKYDGAVINKSANKVTSNPEMLTQSRAIESARYDKWKTIASPKSEVQYKGIGGNNKFRQSKM